MNIQDCSGERRDIRNGGEVTVLLSEAFVVDTLNSERNQRKHVVFIIPILEHIFSRDELEVQVF